MIFYYGNAVTNKQYADSQQQATGFGELYNIRTYPGGTRATGGNGGETFETAPFPSRTLEQVC